jgi:hypothetical protein
MRQALLMVDQIGILMLSLAMFKIWRASKPPKLEYQTANASH